MRRNRSSDNAVCSAKSIVEQSARSINDKSSKTGQQGGLSRLIGKAFAVALYKTASVLDSTFLSSNKSNVYGLIGLPFVVKAGDYTRLEEAELIRYAAALLKDENVYIPKVYCSFKRKGIRYILMEKVKGKQLVKCWDKLSPHQQDSVREDIKTAIARMRQETNDCIVSGLHQGKISHSAMPYMDINGDESFEPFETVADFNKSLLASTLERPAYFACEAESSIFDDAFGYQIGPLRRQSLLMATSLLTTS
jgi:hypothetical protein